MFHRLERTHALPSLRDRFGLRSVRQVSADLSTVARHLVRRDRFRFNLTSAGLLRPELALPAYAGLVPDDGVAPIFNFFDRTGGGRGFHSFVTRDTARDYRGGRLTYDEHDGTDFVCPPGTPLVAAAPGIVVATRDNWLRGGLTACVDHGGGVVTQYTHLSQMVATLGQPVRRGEVLALSGNSGLDMTQFYPLVPPHVHFMVFVDGEPVDPYQRPDEGERNGTWLTKNDPRATEATDEPTPSDLGIDERAVDTCVEHCTDPAIRRELESAPSTAARAAILEDSFHHDRWSWKSGGAKLRRTRATVHLTLPLPAECYRAAKPGDRFFTAPQ